ncbi:hypothetical protein C8F01DRAFT_1124516, partial [Mycena amicta]
LTLPKLDLETIFPHRRCGVSGLSRDNPYDTGSGKRWRGGCCRLRFSETGRARRNGLHYMQRTTKIIRDDEGWMPVLVEEQHVECARPSQRSRLVHGHACRRQHHCKFWGRFVGGSGVTAREPFLENENGGRKTGCTWRVIVSEGKAKTSHIPAFPGYDDEHTRRRFPGSSRNGRCVIQQYPSLAVRA